MSEEQHRDELERLLKSAADDFSVPPSPEVWDRVKETLHPDERGKRRFLYWFWPAAAVALLLGGYLLFSPSPSQKNTTPIKKTASVNNKTSESNRITPAAPNTGEPDKNNPPSLTAGVIKAKTARHSEKHATHQKQPAANPSLFKTGNSKTTQDNQAPNTGRLIPDQTTGNQQPAINSRQPTTNTPAPGAGSPASDPTNKEQLTTTNPQPTANIPALDTGHVTPDPGDHKIRWELFAEPAVSYRTFRAGSSSQRYSNSSADYGRAKSDHHPAMGFHAGIQATIPLKGSWSLGTGLEFSQTGYDITTTGRIYEAPPDGAGATYDVPAPQTSNLAMSGNYLRYMAMPQKPVSYKNRYQKIALPLLIQWEHPAGQHLHIQFTSGVALSYLPGKETLIFYPSTRGYFKDADRLRTWNGDFIAGVSLTAPLAPHWGLNIGPMLHYQLFSTYRDHYPVKEHPFTAGLHVALQWNP